MSRYDQHNSAAAAVANAVGSIQRKENEYKEGIKFSIQSTMYIAESMAKNGEIEKVMMEAAEGMDEAFKEEIMVFLQQQRDRLKKLTLQTIAKEREINAFLSSLDNVRNEVAASDQENEGVRNYVQMITTRMEAEKKKQQSTMVNITETKEYRDLCDTLGEKLPKKYKKGNNSDGDSDSDIEIENKVGSNLKCPLTASWFDEPMKSKLCGHIYSKQALFNYLQKSKVKNCPVAGCSNNRLDEAQLEEDKVTEMKVNKAKRAEEKKKQARLTQAADVAGSDEEF